MRYRQQAKPRNGHDGVRKIMSRVMLALIPGTLASAFYFGPGVVMNLLFAILLAMLLESGVALLRRRSISFMLGDGSVILAAWLLALCLPPLLPFWQIAIGVAAMVLLGKHLYGGLGNNPFNPAMVGYAVLIVSFPLTMSLWSDPQSKQPINFLNTLTVKSQAAGAASNQMPIPWDAISRATPLTQWRTDSLKSASLDSNLEQPGLTNPTSSTGSTGSVGSTEESARRKYSVDTDSNPIQSRLFSTAWPLISLCWLFGGLYLLYSRIISWHIPTCFLLSLGTLHGLHSVFSSSVQMSVPVALLSGGAMLGAFFIATDPVSAPASKLGRCLFATGIGTLTFSLREFSA